MTIHPVIPWPGIRHERVALIPMWVRTVAGIRDGKPDTLDLDALRRANDVARKEAEGAK